MHCKQATIYPTIVVSCYASDESLSPLRENIYQLTNNTLRVRTRIFINLAISVLAHPIFCSLFLSIFVVLFSELNIKRVWFSMEFCTFTAAKATMYYCYNRKPLQCSFKFSILFIFHSYFNFFIRSQSSFNCNTFFNWGIKMESLLII